MSSRNPNRKSTKGEYIETDIGNKISRRSKIEGTPNIILAGRVVVQADVCLRGDLCRLASDASAESKDNGRTSISVGRYTLISTGSTIHPPYRVLRGGEITYYAMKIGENVFIGAGCFISAASVGSHVHIGPGSVIGNGCIIKDYVKILDGSVLPAGMVVPSGVVVGGRPARIIADLPDGWGVSTSTSSSSTSTASGAVAGRSHTASAAATDGDWVEGGELRELIRSIK